jgi:hypothetical protein
MAIRLEFIDFIIPIEKIDLVYPGGFSKLKEDFLMDGNVTERFWHDKYLFRDGAMNAIDIERLVEEWENLGLEGIVEINGQKQWKDFCVVEGMFGGPTLPCDWLVYDGDNNCVYLKNKPKGELIGAID